MKTKILIIVALIATSLTSFAQHGWLIGSNHVLTESTISSSSTLNDLGAFGTSQYTGSDIRYHEPLDDDDWQYFYIRDYKVYDFEGYYRFDLPNFKGSNYCFDGTWVTGINGELSIVPRPGTTDEYYVIYEKNFNYTCADYGADNTGIYYVRVKMNSSNRPELVGLTPGTCYSNILCAGPLGTDITYYNPSVVKYFIGSMNSVSFTVSKAINAKNERYMYVCGSGSGTGKILRFHITNAGIASETTILNEGTVSGNTLDECDFDAHNLVLSPDQHFLAWSGDRTNITCSGSDRPIYVLPLLNYEAYPTAPLSFTNQIHKIANSTNVGGLCFSVDSRYLLYTTDAGIKYALINDANPLSLPSPSTVSGTTNMKKSYLALGDNNHVFCVDESTETLTHFAWPSTTPITTSILAKGNNSNNYNSTYRLPKEYNNVYKYFDIEVDINTKCAPTYSTPAVLPKFTVTTAPPLSVYYNWYPMPGNETTLDDYHSATPEIVSSTGTHLAYYYLTVTTLDGRYTEHKFVKVQLTTSADWDLASRDSHHDMYDEPNSQATVNPDNWNIWGTPDIWSRVTNDGLANQVCENPVYKLVGGVQENNHIYTKVRNVGCVASPGSGANVNLYWTAGGGPETWSNVPLNNYWTDKLFTNLTGDDIPHGLQITTISVPTINPGDFEILTDEWTPPNPSRFTTVAAPAVTSVSICFLSRIVDGHHPTHTDGMTIQELYTGSISANVRNNNNIVTLNSGMSVVLGKQQVSNGDGNAPPKTTVLVLANGGTVTTRFSVQLANEQTLHTVRNGSSTLSNYVRVKLFLGDLYDTWWNAGGHGVYAGRDANEKSVLFDGTNTMQLDSIDIDTGVVHTVGIQVYLTPNADGTKMPEETFHFRQLLGSEVQGGYTYTVKYIPETPTAGVLAVTELSQGPATHSGCEYAELIVGNCGDDVSTHVNIEGWIIDDNAGNFSNDSCDTTFGITAGHLKLAGSVWNHVPVGSRIIVYNGAQNCYAFPSAFTIDNGNRIYWVPVASTQNNNNYISRFDARGNEQICSYCADEGNTQYTNAYGWNDIVQLDAAMDAVQVRCPGCSQAQPGTPQFYHGMAYAASAQSGLSDISADSYSLGGAVVYNSGQANRKYSFVGESAATLSDPQYWIVAAADSAGTPPDSVGYMKPQMMYAALTHALALPCCGEGEQQNKGVSADNAPGVAEQQAAKARISVYPNPAKKSVYFDMHYIATGSIKITDIYGKQVLHKEINNNNIIAIDVSSYAPGIYLYQIATKGITHTGKVIVQ